MNLGKEELDELDSWFDEEEESEVDQSAEADTPEVEEGSPETPTEDASPDEKDLDTDAGTEPPSDEGTSARTSAKDANPYDWVDELPPELKDRAEALVRRDQSNTGRVAALRSRLDEIESEKEARRAITQAPPAQAASAESKPVEDMDDDELASFMEEFPSVARNVKKIVEQRVAQEREEILGTVAPIQEEAAQRKILNEKQKLRTEAERIFNTAETGIHYEDVIQSVEWNEWFTSQPPEYQSFARTANSAEAAAMILRDFDRYARDTFADTPPQEDDSKDTSKADQLAARRQQSLESSSPPSRSATIDSNAVGDYESYFDQAVRERGYDA